MGEISGTTLGLLGTIVGIVLGSVQLVKAMLAVGVRVGKLEAEHALLWKFIFDDAKSSARLRGVVTQNSPLRVDARIGHYLDTNPIGQHILAYYRANGMSKLDDAQATWRLYKTFIDEWEERICTPLAINLSQALVAVLLYCRDKVNA